MAGNPYAVWDADQPCASEGSALQNFTSCVLEFLRSGLKRSKDGDCTELVLQAKEDFRIYLFHKRFCDEFEEILFSLGQVAPCGDKRIVGEALQMFCDRRLSRPKGCFCRTSKAEFWGMIALFSDTTQFEDNPAVRRRYPMDFFCDPRLLMQKQVTSTLLYYGAPLSVTSVPFRLIFTVLLGHLQFLLPLRGNNIREMTSESIGRGYPNISSECRLYIVLLLLYSLLGDLEPGLFPVDTEPKSVLKLVFSSNPQPFVTVAELRRYLSVILGGETAEARIASLCSHLASEFPRAEGPLQPRSLKHLSRCAVRGCLWRRGTVPRGVAQLKIPKQIKSYILLNLESRGLKYVGALESRKRHKPDTSD